MHNSFVYLLSGTMVFVLLFFDSCRGHHFCKYLNSLRLDIEKAEYFHKCGAK